MEATRRNADLVYEILKSCNFDCYISEASDSSPTEAVIVALFSWRNERAGIVVDCGEDDAETIKILGFIPEGIFQDLATDEKLILANASNVETPGLQVFLQDDRIYVRKTVRVDECGIFVPEEFVNAFYDVHDQLLLYRSAARHRGIFPSDGAKDYYEPLPG
jgi:hypothetical protein